MSQFQIFKKEVTISDEQYHLRPLNGEHIDMFFEVLSKLEGVGDGDVDKVSAVMDGETAAKLHKLALVTFIKSYPKERVEDLEEFVTQNLLQLIQPLLEVNIRNPDATRS